MYKHILCVGWGEQGDVKYTEGPDRRAGRLPIEDLERLHADLSQPDVVVVGHNAFKYDLASVNGVMLDHGLPPLPEVRVQDTMSEHKTGLMFRNTLRAQCAKYGVTLKGGGPNWDLILRGDPDEWAKMREYNVNDVVCTLELERALAAHDLPCPIRVWSPRKARA